MVRRGRLVSSPPSTPKSSRSLSDRVLRPINVEPSRLSRLNKVDEQLTRITSFFPVRKRIHNIEYENNCIEKKVRRGNSLTDIEFKSPAIPFSFSERSNKITLDPLRSSVISNPSNVTSNSEYHIPSPLGLFDHVPIDVTRVFISNLSIQNLVSLSLSSTEWSYHIMNYMQTISCRQRFIDEARPFQEESIISVSRKFFTLDDPFYSFGELTKAVTVCHNTSDRIAFFIDFVKKTKNGLSCGAGYSRMLHTVSHKWAFSECFKLLNSMLFLDEGAMLILTKQTVNFPHSHVGSNVNAENKIRQWFHEFILDGRGEESDELIRERAFWLSAVLNTQTSVAERGRLLMILYAPLGHVDGRLLINWRSLCDTSVESWDDAVQRVRPLAEALFNLTNSRRMPPENDILKWTSNDVFNIIEEITTCPEPWSFDNFVCLLLHKTSLIPVSLIARMMHGYEEEAGQMFNTMKLLLYRWGLNVNDFLTEPMINSMRNLTQDKRKALISSMMNAHYRQQQDLILQEGNSEREIREELESWASCKDIIIKMRRLL